MTVDEREVMVLSAYGEITLIGILWIAAETSNTISRTFNHLRRLSKLGIHLPPLDTKSVEDLMVTLDDLRALAIGVYLHIYGRDNDLLMLDLFDEGYPSHHVRLPYWAQELCRSRDIYVYDAIRDIVTSEDYVERIADVLREWVEVTRARLKKFQTLVYMLGPDP